MDSAIRIISPISSTPKLTLTNKSCNGFSVKKSAPLKKTYAVSPNGSVSCSSSPEPELNRVEKAHRKRSSLESFFCYDKPIPEERIEKLVGLPSFEKVIGDNPQCDECEAKGAVLCRTCSGSGLYVDAIMESQGIIVKIRCLGCGGTGNIMCSECGGRGHLGAK